ncbi:MAG: hypothetical protein JWP57_29 [Spirosoma sp.]|nr:hypothetical protein [Spirosoma sp.]
MKQLKYGFYGEDDAHKIFLHNYLSHFANELVFVRDDAFCWKFRARTKKEVDDKFAEVAQRGLIWYQQQVFFVVRDVDSIQENEFTIRYSHFAEVRIDKLLVALPVQCIEHWLWYLKQKKENPSLTKNISLESQPRKKAKFEVYGFEDPPNELSNPIVDDLSKQFDISWLESRSGSFKHFHSQVKIFVAQTI